MAVLPKMRRCSRQPLRKRKIMYSDFEKVPGEGTGTGTRLRTVEGRYIVASSCRDAMLRFME
jgi:hypothetical protein